ncbi:hypothetical protein [Micromonospora aurantiaca (nom. illeg.)]|uniref:hypothetical protein n=1 Tax=Micromonospora aurantiaca (nom. illeg.) TaxID=47850 RepID=UPI00341855C9
MVLVLVVLEASAGWGRRQQRLADAAHADHCRADVLVGCGTDSGVAYVAVRAVDDAGAVLPGQWWAVAAMRRTNRPTEITSHPGWCAPDRCGHLVPPLMAHMARRHRGTMFRVGDVRSSGVVVTYLIGADALAPLVAVHSTCRVGNCWAELSLSQVAELIEHLRGLLKQAGGDQGAGYE